MPASVPGSGFTKTTMNCPICSVGLIMSERQSIEIDYCPQCRGVWLDRGELDKIIEFSMQQITPPAQEYSNDGDNGNYRDEGNYSGGYGDQGGYSDKDQYRGSRHGSKQGGSKHGSQHGGKYGRRKENKLEWLKDLFD